jgi:hypothetical protein
MTARALTLIPLLTALAGAAQADAGLRLDDTASSDFKARIALMASDHVGGTRFLGAQFLGDYYITGGGSGLRLSGGLMVGSSSLLGTGTAPGGPQVLSLTRRTLAGWGDEPQSQQPYLGVGYSQHSLKGGWGFSADLGLAVSGGSGLRLGSTSAFAQSLDDSLRRLQWTPVVQVGLSYRF